MKSILSTLLLISMLCAHTLSAQDQKKDSTIRRLSSNIRFSDIDHNDSLSKEEVWTVFQQYLSNPSRNVSSDITSDVECVVIDLIAYLEKVNCDALKNTKGTKAFIELYFVDRFASAK